MLRFKVVMVVLALATSACSYKHSGKAMIGGIVMAGAGMYVFTASAEAEGDTNMPAVGLGMVGLGAIIAVAGLMSAVGGPELERPAEKPPAPPPPPAVIGSEELRSQKRVAQYMAAHGKCDQVLQISARVETADPKFHAGSFATDQAIARCLVSGSPAPAD